MNEPEADVAAQSPARARSYGWRLSFLLPALLLAGYGYWRHVDLPPGGSVTSIRLTTKPDLAGQTRDAYDSINPGTSDFYLVVHRRDGEPLRTTPFDDTPLGNGLGWPIEPAMALDDVVRVEVWDDNGMLRDKQLDRIELLPGAWSAAGQTYQVTLQGTRAVPPAWALPMLAAGATLAGVILLKFVWDQAI